MPRTSLSAAAATLAERDADLARIVAQVGPPKLRPPRPTSFEALARAIAFQQLSGKAATAIFARVEAVVGEVQPDRILAVGEEALRGAGLSAAKTASLIDLSRRVISGSLPLDDVRRLDDEALIDRLVAVRGIGRWTAEMFLIFQLHRPDVWPVDDLAVRKGYARMHRLAVAPTPKELAALGDAYRPYRSVAAWYCWRASEITELPG